jgi:dynamin 1-like protein
LIQHKEEELRNSGESAITDYEKSNKSGLLLNILNKFSTQFNDVINGRNSISTTGELFGGARINYIFNDIFIKAINQLDPFEIMSDGDIRAAIRNSNGLSPSLTVSEAAFEILVKEHISRLEEPSLDCATLVYEELKRIVYNLRIPELTRFEALKNAVNTVIEKL